MSITLRTVAIVLFSLGLSACQTLQTFYDGEIKFSERTAKHFESFLKDDQSSEFYTAIDGRSWSTYIYCNDTKSKAQNRHHWIHRCSEKASPVPCGLFSTKRKILWDNPGNFMPYKSEIVKETYGEYFYGSSRKKTILKKDTVAAKLAGRDTIQLTNSAAKDFVNFLKDRSKTYSYITSDGEKLFSSSCKDNKCEASLHHEIINNCKEISTKECYLFASKKRFYWQHAGNFMPFKAIEVFRAYGSYYHRPKDLDRVEKNSIEADKYAGKGSIKLSARATNSFVNFLRTPDRKFFYATKDGLHGFTDNCEVSKCPNASHKKSVASCMLFTGPNCYLFASKEKIIWKDAGDFMPYKSAQVFYHYGDYFAD